MNLLYRTNPLQAIHYKHVRRHTKQHTEWNYRWSLAKNTTQRKIISIRQYKVTSWARSWKQNGSTAGQGIMKTIHIQLTISGPVVILYTITFNIKRCYSMPWQCIAVSTPQNIQRLFPYTTFTDSFYNPDGVCLLCGTNWLLNTYV
jgi:hypothetical protein